ncbi:MAG: hypothetical protein QXF17_06080 [Ignisphaera sp.]
MTDKLFYLQQIETRPHIRMKKIGNWVIRNTDKRFLSSLLLDMHRAITLYYAARENSLYLKIEWFTKTWQTAGVKEYYKLKPIKDAVVSLLQTPIRTLVKRVGRRRNGNTIYRCYAMYSQASLEREMYEIGLSVNGIRSGNITYGSVRLISYYYYSEYAFPTNVGPLKPIWQQMVQRWLEEINNTYDPVHADLVRPRLLREVYANSSMIDAIEWL